MSPLRRYLCIIIWTFGICFVINNFPETLQRALRVNLTEKAGVSKLSDLMKFQVGPEQHLY